MGLATAYHLARDGRRVLLLEARGIGHEEGSSHGPSRMIRLTYQSEDYIALARASYALWRLLGEEAGEPVLVQCGGLDFGPPDATNLAALGQAMTRAGVAHEAVDAEEIRRRFPLLTPPDDVVGFYQADYAMLAADRCIELLAAGARAAGAEVREHEPVLAVTPSGDGVEVRTAVATYRADSAVLANGSWIGPLAAALGVQLPLTVLKEQLAYFEPADPASSCPAGSRCSSSASPARVRSAGDSPSSGTAGREAADRPPRPGRCPPAIRTGRSMPTYSRSSSATRPRRCAVSRVACSRRRAVATR